MKARASSYRKERRRVNPVKERVASSQSVKECYGRNLEHCRALSRRSTKERYIRDLENSRALSRRSTKKSYNRDLGTSRALSRRSTKQRYNRDLENSRALSRRSTNEFYETDKGKSQATSRSSSQRDYLKHCEQRRFAKKRLYRSYPLCKLIASKRLYAKKRSAKSRANKAYYAKHRNTLRSLRRDKYALAEPLHDRKEAIQKVIQNSILQNKEARDQLVKAFKSEHPTSVQSMSSKMLKRAVCRIAVSKLLCKVFQLRRKQVGNFLATCRSIKTMQIVSEAIFGFGPHYKSNKPILYDSAYRLWPRNMPLPVNGDGECVMAEEVIVMK